MTLLKDDNYKEINVALLSLEADIKNKIAGFDTSAIDKQLVEINNRIDKINAGGNNTSAEINDIRYEIEDINTKIKGNSAKIEDIEKKLSDIFSAESKVTDFNTTTNSGIYYWLDDAANKPGTDYGVLLVNKYDRGDNNSIWVNQIAYGTNNKIYFRQNINSGNWTEWKAVAFEGEVNADRATGIRYTGEDDSCISAAQTSESYNNSSADWASYIICNHGNGKTYYHQMLRLPFFSDTIQLQRRVNGELQGWKNVAIIENSNNWSGTQTFSTAKASGKMVIPIGEPSQLEDGCIWIER